MEEENLEQLQETQDNIEHSEQTQQAQIIENIENADELLTDSLEKLYDYDGFLLFEDAIEGADSLDPERPGKKSRFLTNPDKKEERSMLKAKLQTWLDLVANSDNLGDLITSAEEKAKQSQQGFTQNLKTALDASRELEISYRSVAAFFNNTGDTADKVMFLNTTMENVQDITGKARAYEALKAKLEETYNTFDLENTIGAIVIPGYLGSKAAVSKYARLAKEYKTLLITDYWDTGDYKTLKKEFQKDKLAGSDKYLANALMCAVYVQGRATEEELGEEPLYLPPSAFLAGKIYQSHESDATTVAQPAAGEKYGELYEAEEVKFKLLKSETGDLEELGLIPMVKVRGKVVPMSAKTLFNGDNVDLTQYAIVRIFDWVTKILVDYLNRKTFELFTSKNQNDIYNKILKFMDDLKRSNVIKDYSKPQIKADPNDPTKVFVNLGITPLYATKAFHISLKGEKNKDGTGGTVSEV